MNSELSQANWFKSSRSQPQGECVEIAFLDADRIAVRDSKNPSGPVLTFAPSEWDAFTVGVKGGEFDHR
ncbi:DUF397 domain-containing protein [Nocardia heshunensis]